MKRLSVLIVTVILFGSLIAGLTACGNRETRNTNTGIASGVSASGENASQTGAATEPGSIVFTANGEDFVRRGFVDKQGWSISFDNLYINIDEPTAYVPEGDKEVVLKGSHWLDLAEGDAEAELIVIGSAPEAPPANYQGLRFAIRRVSDGPFAGSSIVMIGSAEREGLRVPFTIRLDEEMVFDGPDGYVGDELKGLLQPGSTTEVEMTFHFDHLFGDIEADAEDHINTGSVGFDFFYAFAENGAVDVSQAELQGAEGYGTLVHALWTLGHLGEGHCEVSQQSSKDIL